MPKRERLDRLMAVRGLCESASAAQRSIRAGKVRVNDQLVLKPGTGFADDVRIEIAVPPPYVSRGGEKLAHALTHFAISVEGLVCLDIGSSTGGFTDCMLQNGATRVIALDVGRGQLHWQLRCDSRVTVMEKTNARYMQPSDLDAVPQFVSIDVSFISLTKIMPAIRDVLEGGRDLVTLIKPQFEAGRHEVGAGGVVRDPAVHDAVVARIADFGVNKAGFEWLGVCPSPLKGPAGNVEFLAHWRNA